MRKAKSRKPQQKNASRATGHRALIRIDQEPIRKKALTEFKRINKILLRERQELSHHFNVVRPSYRHWIFSIAGEKIQKITTLENQLRDRTILLRRIEQLVYEEFVSPRNAYVYANQEYEEARNQVNQGDLFEHEQDSSSDEDPEFHQDKDPDQGEPFDAESFFEEVFEDLASFMKGDLKKRKRKVRGESGFVESQENGKEQRIKALYRKMARALHPDTGAELNGPARALWPEVVAAYKANDLESLETLWVSVELISDPQGRAVVISDFNRLSEYLITQSHKIKREKKLLAREDPAWKFETKDRTELARRILSDLSNAERKLTGILKEIEGEINTYGQKKGRSTRVFR